MHKYTQIQRWKKTDPITATEYANLQVYRLVFQNLQQYRLLVWRADQRDAANEHVGARKGQLASKYIGEPSRRLQYVGKIIKT